MGHNGDEWAGALGAMETGGPKNGVQWKQVGQWNGICWRQVGREMRYNRDELGVAYHPVWLGCTIRYDQHTQSRATRIYHPLRPGYTIRYHQDISSGATRIFYPVQAGYTIRYDQDAQSGTIGMYYHPV
jgi:hypothetical protein